MIAFQRVWAIGRTGSELSTDRPNRTVSNPRRTAMERSSRRSERRHQRAGFRAVVTFVVPSPEARIWIFRVPAARGMAHAAARDHLGGVEKPFDDNDFPLMVATILGRAVLPVPRPRRVHRCTGGRWEGPVDGHPVGLGLHVPASSRRRAAAHTDQPDVVVAASIVLKCAIARPRLTRRAITLRYSIPGHTQLLPCRSPQSSQAVAESPRLATPNYAIRDHPHDRPCACFGRWSDRRDDGLAAEGNGGTDRPPRDSRNHPCSPGITARVLGVANHIGSVADHRESRTTAATRPASAPC